MKLSIEIYYCKLNKIFNAIESISRPDQTRACNAIESNHSHYLLPPQAEKKGRLCFGFQYFLTRPQVKGDCGGFHAASRDFRRGTIVHSKLLTYHQSDYTSEVLDKYIHFDFGVVRQLPDFRCCVLQILVLQKSILSCRSKQITPSMN